MQLAGQMFVNLQCLQTSVMADALSSFRYTPIFQSNNSTRLILSAQGVIRIRPCGVAYWLITLFQLPAAVAFTGYIIYAKRKKHVVHSQDQEDGKVAWQFYLYYIVAVAKLKAIWNDDDDDMVMHSCRQILWTQEWKPPCHHLHSRSPLSSPGL